MQTDLKNQLIAWASMHNLNLLIGFHNYVRALFKGQLQELEKLENKDKEGKLSKNVLYDYDRNLHVNTFLMMYSYLEEWLYLDWKVYAPNVKLVDRKGSIGRFMDVVKQLGVDLSSKYWQVLKDAEEIRNCLLHANGRISLLTNPHKVKRIKTIIEKKGSRFRVNAFKFQRVSGIMRISSLIFLFEGRFLISPPTGGSITTRNDNSFCSGGVSGGGSPGRASTTNHVTLEKPVIPSVSEESHTPFSVSLNHCF